MKIIEIIIDSQGHARLQTKGYAGTDCRSASAELEKALGIPTAEQLTGEFHQNNAVAQQEQQRTLFDALASWRGLLND